MGRLVRVHNWESILNRQIAKARSTTFKLGTMDCTIWTVLVLRSYTDLDYKVPYNNRAEALVLQEGGDMKQIAIEVMGIPRMSLTLAKRGDLVMKGTLEESTLGICLGEYSAFLSEIGVSMYKTLECSFSWEV